VLQRQPLSAHTRRAYRIRVHQYADYLRSRLPDYGDPLQDPHARDYATRDYKMFLKTMRRAKPRTVNLSLAAIGGKGPANLSTRIDNYLYGEDN
jgi:hypothetical protein